MICVIVNQLVFKVNAITFVSTSPFDFAFDSYLSVLTQAFTQEGGRRETQFFLIFNSSQIY